MSMEIFFVSNAFLGHQLENLLPWAAVWEFKSAKVSFAKTQCNYLPTEILNSKAQFERKIMAKVCDIRNAHALNSIQK